MNFVPSKILMFGLIYIRYVLQKEKNLMKFAVKYPIILSLRR